MPIQSRIPAVNVPPAPVLVASSPTAAWVAPFSPKHRAHKRRGFTLIELLVTILLISILFTIGLLFTSGLSSTRKMRDYEIAIALAQQAIESLRASPYGMLDDADVGDKSVEADFNTAKGVHDMFEPTYKSGDVTYNRQVVVEEIPPAEKDGTPPGVKYCRVTVRWAAPDGEKLAYEVTTTIADLH